MSTSLRALMILFLASPVLAHGGMYRGPGNPSTGGPIPGGPGTPGGGASGPTTGSRGTSTSGTGWETWWEFNKDRFLRLKEALGRGELVTGSDEFYMGQGTRRLRTTAIPTARQKREQLIPALLAALRSTRNRDILTACMVGLAKIGPQDGAPDLQPMFLELLSRRDQEIRETAALSLGIAGDPRAVGPLTDLLLNTREGRRLVGKGEVSDRTRAFAAYSLGLLAGRSEDHELKEKVFGLLRPLLVDRFMDDRELKVAVVEGVGLLDPLGTKRAKGQRLLWQATAALWVYYDQDVGKAEQRLQAHVPIAVARLLGRGTSMEHERCKERLIDELRSRRSRHNTIYQSAALALGAIALPREEREEDGKCSDALLEYYGKGSNQQARYFALISLGRIGGNANRNKLLILHAGANKATARPWAALGLGLIGYQYRTGHPDENKWDAGICEVLHRDLQEIDNKSAQAGTALALGLCGYSKASATILELIDKNTNFPATAGYMCVALALMDERSSIDSIRRVIGESVRKPELLRQGAVALGRLGDQRVAPLLLQLIANNDNVATLGSVAGALGYIGDRRTIPPLLELLADTTIAKLGRAFVAAALGGIADKDPFPWNMSLSENTNYRAAVDTLFNGQSGVLDIL